MLKLTSHLRLTVAVVIVTLTAGFGALAPTAGAYTVQSITPWMSNAAPVGWSSSLNRVIYNSVGTNGLWNAYSATPAGADPQCLTCTIPSLPGVGTQSNRGASDVSPNGQYMLVTVERQHAGMGAMWTQPGKGGANDVWLYTTDGQHAWELTNIYQLGSIALGSIWPRFDRTGNEIVWSSMTSPAIGNFGYWQLKVANIVWSDGVPSLADIRTLNPMPNSFYEPYGFTADDQHIVFASNAGGGLTSSNAIYEMNINGSGLTQISPSAPAGVANYAEFAFFTPGNDALIWGRGYDTGVTGMDYWISNPDGSDPQRLTFFNEPWSTEYLGYAITGGLTFNPNNPDQMLAGIATGINAQTINAVMITLNPSTTAGQMTEQLYSDPNFTTLVTTTTSDLSDGYKAPGPPAPGMPATNYSIRWTGTITAPQTGAYQFCVTAEFRAQLFLAGTELVNASFLYGRLQCGTLTLTTGTTVPITIDYEHGTGNAYAQLSWIPPGANTAQIIPSNLITPTTPTTTTPTTTQGSTTTSTQGSTTTTSTQGSTTTTADPTPTATGTRGHGRSGSTVVTAPTRTHRSSHHPAKKAKRPLRTGHDRTRQSPAPNTEPAAREPPERRL